MGCGDQPVEKLSHYLRRFGASVARYLFPGAFGSVPSGTQAANKGLGNVMLPVQTDCQTPLACASPMALAVEGIGMYVIMAWLESGIDVAQDGRVGPNPILANRPGRSGIPSDGVSRRYDLQLRRELTTSLPDVAPGAGRLSATSAAGHSSVSWRP